MKICFLQENSVSNETINDPSLNCVFLFSQVEPRQNLFIDWLTVSCMIVFIFINFFSAFFFIKLKRNGKILSSMRYSYLLLTIVSSVLHVVSIFMTYGFFWPDINNAITSHTCSLWSFWLQWFCGFSIWITILFLRIFTIAQTTITQIISENPAIRFVQRTAVVIVLIGLILIIGILGEAFSSFYKKETGQCTASMFIKMSILIWLVTVIVLLMVMSYIIKKKSIIQDNAHLLNIELKIVRFAWPILLIDILLNFSGLTIYPLIRFLFITLIILMYLWATVILYANQILVYYFGHNPYVGAFLDYYEINSDLKYQKLLNSSEHIDPAIRESFDEDDHFNEIVMNIDQSKMITTPADILMPASSQPQVFDNYVGALSSFDPNDIMAKNKLTKLIMDNNQLFDFFCKHIRGYCLQLRENSEIDKTITFPFWNAEKSQNDEIEVSVIYFIDFMLKFDDVMSRYKFGHQMDDAQFIQQITFVLNEFVDSNIGKLKDLSEKDISHTVTGPRPLTKLSHYTDLSNIITMIDNDYHLTQETFKQNILKKIMDIFTLFKSHFIIEYYAFYSQLNGINEMISDQKEKQQANSRIHQQFDELF